MGQEFSLQLSLDLKKYVAGLSQAETATGGMADRIGGLFKGLASPITAIASELQQVGAVANAAVAAIGAAVAAYCFAGMVTASLRDKSPRGIAVAEVALLTAALIGCGVCVGNCGL